MIIHLKKHTEGNVEYIQATDVFEAIKGDECDPKIQAHFRFLSIVEEYVNFFNEHTSNAFGTPELWYLEGQIKGYCLAKGWNWEEERDYIRVSTRAGRTLYRIDKVPLSEAEKANRQELKTLLENL